MIHWQGEYASYLDRKRRSPDCNQSDDEMVGDDAIKARFIANAWKQLEDEMIL